MKKKITKSLICVICVFSFLFSCQKSVDVQKVQPEITPLPSSVEKQIIDAKKNLALLNIPASIVSYGAESEIKEDNQLSALKQTLVGNDNIVPEFDGVHGSSFRIAKIQDRMNAFRQNPDEEQNIVQNIQDIVFPEIKKGQKVMDILWHVSGQEFHSKCIYADTGIVYDNMLSNIAMVEMAEPSAKDVKLTSSMSREDAQKNMAKQYSFTSTVLDYTIKWLWGSTRGKIVITHYIIWNGSNYIYDDGGTEDAWMSIGSASGRWARNYLNHHSRSKMAWAYGWATPTASFSIKLSAKYLTFSTSTSGVGSRGSGSGVHTIYLQN